MEKMENRVYQYIKDFGAITTFEAFTDLGCTRLSEYIRRLRLKFKIDDEWIYKTNRYGQKVKFKKFFFAEEE